ncbi:hypothetical protein LXA43DRAFT_618032 [Ganoderma leucocontextum]|nr:hypothetical protein LXA43DRAFT_618032 [Ganoderma leucocontextum]
MDPNFDPRTTSILLSVILEGVFLLLFVVTYIFGSWIIVRRAPPVTLRRPSTTLFVAGTAMFLLAVAHFALDLHIMLHVPPTDIEDRTMPSWYASIAKAKFMIYVTQTLIADGFMTYRLYVVWDRCWPALFFPAIMLLLDAVLGYAAPLTKSVPTPYFFVASLLTNIMCTVFIMSRVVFFTYRTSSTRPTLLRKVIEGMVQSAAIYSAASVVLVVTIFASAHVVYVACLNVFPALIGLVFSFLVIRVGMQATEGQYLPVSQMQESQMIATSKPWPAIPPATQR